MTLTWPWYDIHKTLIWSARNLQMALGWPSNEHQMTFRWAHMIFKWPSHEPTMLSGILGHCKKSGKTNTFEKFGGTQKSRNIMVSGKTGHMKISGVSSSPGKAWKSVRNGTFDKFGGTRRTSRKKMLVKKKQDMWKCRPHIRRLLRHS